MCGLAILGTLARFHLVFQYFLLPPWVILSKLRHSEYDIPDVLISELLFHADAIILINTVNI